MTCSWYLFILLSSLNSYQTNRNCWWAFWFMVFFDFWCHSVDISSSESFLKGGHKPSISVQSAGHAVHVFVNGQFMGMQIHRLSSSSCISLVWSNWSSTKVLILPGSAFGTREQRSCTFNGPISLRAGANKIALLSVAVGLPVSAFLQEHIKSYID